MDLNTITTLENLRDYISKKHENEWKDFPFKDILKKQIEVLSIFELSSDEYEYASVIKLITEDQSVKKTIINTSKAKQILIKKKK